MQIFTNKFTIAVNAEKTEVILNFFQNIPTFPPDGTPSSEPVPAATQIVPVANLAMSGLFAKNLAETILKMLDTEPQPAE